MAILRLLSVHHSLLLSVALLLNILRLLDVLNVGLAVLRLLSILWLSLHCVLRLLLGIHHLLIVLRCGHDRGDGEEERKTREDGEVERPQPRRVLRREERGLERPVKGAIDCTRVLEG